MARRTNNPDNKKVSRLYASCTDREYNMITDFAEEKGYSISLLIRLALLDYIRRDGNGRNY